MRPLHHAQEFASGGSLVQYIRSQPNQRLQEPDAQRIFLQMISALDYCHRRCAGRHAWGFDGGSVRPCAWRSRGWRRGTGAHTVVVGGCCLIARRVIHRDLKPENILMDDRGNIKIADFGLAAVTAPFGKGLTTQCGTPEFTAPEITVGACSMAAARCEGGGGGGGSGAAGARRKPCCGVAGHLAWRAGKEYDGPSVDVWSMGVILYEALTGHLPFMGATQSALFKAIQKRVPSAAACHAPGPPAAHLAHGAQANGVHVWCGCAAGACTRPCPLTSRPSAAASSRACCGWTRTRGAGTARRVLCTPDRAAKHTVAPRGGAACLPAFLRPCRRRFTMDEIMTHPWCRDPDAEGQADDDWGGDGPGSLGRQDSGWQQQSAESNLVHGASARSLFRQGTGIPDGEDEASWQVARGGSDHDGSATGYEGPRSLGDVGTSRRVSKSGHHESVRLVLEGDAGERAGRRSGSPAAKPRASRATRATHRDRALRCAADDPITAAIMRAQMATMGILSGASPLERDGRSGSLDRSLLDEDIGDAGGKSGTSFSRQKAAAAGSRDLTPGRCAARGALHHLRPSPLQAVLC